MTITSRDNRFIRLARQLVNDAKMRRTEGLFLTEGARLCADAAVSGIKMRVALYTSGAAMTYGKHLEEIRAVCPEVYQISESLSQTISDTTSPQGVFCICEMLDNTAGLVTMKRNLSLRSYATGWIALENLQDPANMGTIIRTAEAFGLDGLILSADCCDIYNPKVLRGSMGGIFRLPIVTVGRMTDAVAEMQTAGMTCFACVPDDKTTPLTKTAFRPNSVCLIGNEGNGLRPETAAVCKQKITIPMAGQAESLNASMAAGIVMWEMAKASGKPDKPKINRM